MCGPAARASADLASLETSSISTVGVRGPLSQPRWQALQLPQAEGGLDLGHAIVGSEAFDQPAEAGRTVGLPWTASWTLPWSLKLQARCPERVVVQGQQPALAARGDDLVLAEREGRDVAELPDRPCRHVRAPCAWAQSSITTMPLCRPRRMIGSMSAGHPARWTTMTARVRGVSTAAIDSAVMAWLSGSTSAKTGMPPAIGTQEAEATKLRGVTMTSSPGCRPMACSARSSATCRWPARSHAGGQSGAA